VEGRIIPFPSSVTLTISGDPASTKLLMEATKLSDLNPEGEFNLFYFFLLKKKHFVPLFFYFFFLQIKEEKS
jgi:hypothetical protein